MVPFKKRPAENLVHLTLFSGISSCALKGKGRFCHGCQYIQAKMNNEVRAELHLKAFKKHVDVVLIDVDIV